MTRISRESTEIGRTTHLLVTDAEVSIRPGMSADLMCPQIDTLRNPRERILPRCNAKWRNFANRLEIFSMRDNHRRLKDPGRPSKEKELAATDEHLDRDEKLAANWLLSA